jgi:hypothetical protein
MRSTARQTRANRTITVDFQNEATYFQLLGDESMEMLGELQNSD